MLFLPVQCLENTFLYLCFAQSSKFSKLSAILKHRGKNLVKMTSIVTICRHIFVVFMLIYLATAQISGQLNKSARSYNSFKRLLQAKKFIRGNSVKEKNLLLYKQTPPTNAFNYVGSHITEPISVGKVYYG